MRFDPGLLAAADGGVLYVDEINLLPDHLVDLLLDVAASGVNRVEREGISNIHSSRFLLVGSMNPEEGELRPQLLDRFGLAVESGRRPIRASEPPRSAAASTSTRSPDGSYRELADAESGLAARLRRLSPQPSGASGGSGRRSVHFGGGPGFASRPVDLPGRGGAGRLGGAGGQPSRRRRVAPLALAHRARRDPFDPTGMDGER